MIIELRGIVQYWRGGKKHVEVVVDDDSPGELINHRVGVDIVVDRDTILKFLAELYGVQTDKIVWPEHIKAVDMGS